MKRILLIDDDADDRFIFRAALEMIEPKTEYVEAKDGQEALDLILTKDFTPPHLIFVDLNMPRVNGLEFVIRTRQLPAYKDIPTSMYTTSASPNERVNAITAGASGYIIKHVRYNDLAKELSDLISATEASA